MWIERVKWCGELCISLVTNVNNSDHRLASAVSPRSVSIQGAAEGVRNGMGRDFGQDLGLGLGLRNSHFNFIQTHWPQVDWFEAISENFMDSGGRARYVLREIAERYPIVLHGVSMSIGSTDPIDLEYLRKLKSLAEEVQARWVSDHLCWTGTMGFNTHDLLPMPLTEESLAHVTERVHQVQEFLGRSLVLENPSAYTRFKCSTLSEPGFFTELVKRTGCKLLLDVNNVFVSCFNFGADPYRYLEQYPLDHVVQLHVAGHEHCGTHLIDTHDAPVSADVWALFASVWNQCEGISTLLEWDGNIPAFEVCQAEIQKAKQFMNSRPASSQQAHARPPRPSISPASEGTSSASTPLNFLVPSVMASSSLESV